MVLGVVLELLGRDGGAEEVLQVLEHILLGGREGARLRVVVEVGHIWRTTGGVLLEARSEPLTN